MNVQLHVDCVGMFLYARLVLEHLKNQTNVEAIRKEVENLPTGLDEA